ncbi:alkaline phosphatase-like [Toxorhynchites rutilus septentrionalis]|uniref:alkaline phosphatase-like n=1 Tax=Toxorhynchites rutilus septentrionalis TaxID=329112 RepID=UPI00247AA168|nr:alkaline phosphatase-like [Toxorhynchites rutilus septentrionalis]
MLRAPQEVLTMPLRLTLLLLVLIGGASCAVEEEHDPMHPQSFLFERGAGRQRRGTARMPTLRFNPAEAERDQGYWNNVAQDTLGRQLDKNQLNTNVAKNIIMFLGDGLSIPTLAATRVFLGDESTELSFEKFPYVGLSKTYCANVQVADSACTATAFLAGVKANYGTIGLTAAAPLGDCNAQNDTAHHVQSIAKWAQDYGMATGFVTTTQVTNASPAGVYANTANRNWENNQQVLDDGYEPAVCPDIATQLIEGAVGSNLKVIMGGGRREFLPTTSIDIDGIAGRRTDGIDLIKRWQRKHAPNHTAYVQNRDQLLEVDKNTEYLLGLFDAKHLPYHIDADARTKPTLEEMVAKALDVLENDGRGYFLFIEGGRIDHGHHYTQPMRAFDETVEFAKAIDMARQRTSPENTLIVVTADHSHTMTMSGYSSRKHDILGVNNGQNADDNLPYATISYANGPGYGRNVDHEGRLNLQRVDMHDKSFEFPTMVPLGLETHGGDDVAVFASGPWAHLFTGTYEQHYIPHAMAYAACIGHGKTACMRGGERI